MKNNALRTVKNVELMRAGISYQLSTGPRTFTPEELRSVVMAANEDMTIPKPRLKIGHIDPRFNNSKIYDGSPAFGMASNLRLSENGMAVMADYEGVPSWLAEVMPVAYPSRSIEGWSDVESSASKKWPFVLTACSLLGVSWPGITVLEDLPMYYGEEAPDTVSIDPELAAAARQYAGLVAAGSQPGGDPQRMKTAASANLDDVRRAFYNEYVTTNPEARYFWICAVLTDPNQLVIENDETGQLYLLPFESDASGNVTFGDSAAVRVDYVPDDREVAAASFVAATRAMGRQVLASWPTRAASRPDNAPGGRMDPKQLRLALGLAEDASDEEVKQALAREGLTPTAEEPATPATPPAGPETPPAEPTTPPAEPETKPTAVQPPERIAASHGLQLPPGTALVDEATLASFRSVGERLQRMEEREATSEREGLVAAAVSEGRIPPARREYWMEYLSHDMEGGRQILASFPANIVPLAERGVGRSTTGDDPEVAANLESETVSSWTHQLFPETRNGAVHASAGGDLPSSSRIQSDGKYNRR